MRNRSGLLFWCGYLLIVSQILWADHLPSSKIARGKPEHVLARVNVYHDSIESIIQRLGKPDKVVSTTNADYPPGSGERSYEWNRDGVRLRVGSEFRTDKTSQNQIESAPMIVDVWGVKKGDFGITGRGLSLGTDLSTIEKAYGSRFQENQNSIIIQWQDETTLIIDCDRQGRIIHMQLLAATE